MLPGATHMLDGREAEAAQALAEWVDKVVLGGGN
jgi:hypothetical protein